LESLGIVKRDDTYEQKKFTSRHKRELVQSRMVVGMYEAQQEQGVPLSLQDYKAYKLAVNRVQGIEQLMAS